MDDDAPDTDQIGGVGHPHRSITKQGAAQALALIGRIHGQPRQKRDRNRVWHVAPKPPRHVLQSDAMGGDGVKTNDPPRIANHESPRSPAGLVG